MNLLEKRKGAEGVIEGRFISKTLKDAGDELIRDSERVMRSKGFKSAKFFNHSISVADNEMVYQHTAAERFVDMKTRNISGRTNPKKKVKRSGKVSKKNYPVHNKPIFTQKRFIVRMLSFGFTEEIKNSFRELIKNEQTKL